MRFEVAGLFGQRFLNVARTVTPAIVMTTAAPRMLLPRILDIEGVRIVKVTPAHPNNPHWVRAAGFRTNILPWGKVRLKTAFEDHLTAKMPDDVFVWYNPVRKYYAKIAVAMLDKVLKEKYGKPVDQQLSEAWNLPHGTLLDSIRKEVERMVEKSEMEPIPAPAAP